MADNITLSWRPDLAQVIERQRAWYEGQLRYLVTVIPDSWPSFDWDLSIDVKTPRPLETFDFGDDAQLDEFLAFRLEQYEVYWRIKADWGLDDDYIPTFEPRLAWAEHVASVVQGSEVHLYAQTSAIDPVIEDYETFDWDRIRYDPSGAAGTILCKANRWAAEHGRGHFLVQPRGLDANPSDFAKACRGEPFFLDFILHPDGVKRLMECCLQACIDLIEHQRQLIGGMSLGGYGTTWNGGYWSPGNALGHLGDNVSDLVSGDTFREFIAPHLRDFVKHFGGAIFGRDVSTKQLWSELRGLGNILAFKPRNVGSVHVTPDHIRTIAECTDRLPLSIEVFSLDKLASFIQATQEVDIQAYFVVHCRTREEGARALDTVRSIGQRQL
jgi:hypothetical protein